MKKFILEISILYSLLLGLVGYYSWGVKPNISGDIGRVGQIPFGKEYKEQIESSYVDLELRVRNVNAGEEIPDSIITIGDSFSNDGIYCYNFFLARELNKDISNIVCDLSPEQTFVRLVNQKMIPRGAIVIIESVERNMIERLTKLNLEDSIAFKPKYSSDKQTMGPLDETFMWVRKSLGIKNPVLKFHIDRELFSHASMHKELFVYDSRWDDDGDLRYAEDQHLEDDIRRTWNNIYELYSFALENSIRLVYLIPADKYDVYELFILETHIENPTLATCPNEPWIVNTKPLLQSHVLDGVKDVYWLNDTHWSPIGAQIVGEELSRRIIELYN